MSAEYGINKRKMISLSAAYSAGFGGDGDGDKGDFLNSVWSSALVQISEERVLGRIRKLMNRCL